MQTVVDRFPGFAPLIGPEPARRRDRDEDSLVIFRIDQNCVETPSPTSGLAFRSGVMLAEAGEFAPRFAAVLRFEQRGVFHARVNMIGVIERGLEGPDALAFPWIARALLR